MMQKIVVSAVSHEQFRALGQRHSFEQGVIVSGKPDGGVVAVVFPRHAHTRFALSQEDGVTVFPGMHDPTPIGAAVAAALAHVNAKPTETMRAVALRLHAVHGPAFHPDT